jgi:hypothetical protein
MWGSSTWTISTWQKMGLNSPKLELLAMQKAKFGAKLVEGNVKKSEVERFVTLKGMFDS